MPISSGVTIIRPDQVLRVNPPPVPAWSIHWDDLAPFLSSSPERGASDSERFGDRRNAGVVVMDIHSDLHDFSGGVRLFPLPNVVLFPHVILPLHIFEPRYRQMTEDALQDDHLITMVQSRPIGAGSPCFEPVPIYQVGCVGRIVQHDRLPDGRFHLLLLGCKRVRLVQETPSPKLYRLARAALLEDQEPTMSLDHLREELIQSFLEVLNLGNDLDSDLAKVLHSNLPLGTISDIMAHALDAPASVKQSLLEELRVADRVSSLLAILRASHDPQPHPRRFPKPFSLN